MGMRAPKHIDEEARIAYLESYLSDLENDPALQDLVAYAAEVCGTPVSLVSLLEGERQRFAAVTGLEASETSITDSFCAHAIFSDGVFEIHDALLDARFADNALVLGDPNIRFYAGTPLKTSEGIPVGAICVIDTQPKHLTDFQKRTLALLAKQAESQLELRRQARELEKQRNVAEVAQFSVDESSKFLRLVTDRLPVQVAYIDNQLRFQFMNDAYARVAGIDRTIAIGRPIAEAANPGVLEAVRANLQRSLNGESHTQEFAVPYDSGTKQVRVSYVPDFDSEGVAIGVVVQILDVTDQRQAEEALRVSEQRLQNLFRMSPSAIAVLRGRDLVFEYANDAYLVLIGRRDIIGKPLHAALPEIAGQGFFEALQSVFDTGERYIQTEAKAELRVSAEGPLQDFYVSLLYQPLVEADGSIDSIFVHAVDVTDQVVARSEVVALNDALEARVADRTQQLQAAVKEAEGFNYSISHDLRAPLRAIASTSKMLLEDLGPSLQSEDRLLLTSQADNATRLGRLIDELLRLSRLARAEVNRKPLDITKKAVVIFEDLHLHDKANGCSFMAQMDMTAEGDSELVKTVLHNLIENALKFSPAGGQITMSQVDNVYSVSDQGVGLDMRYASKVFLPFERLVTEAEFPGTGIGLANVKRIVERHGGKIWVESQPGQGSTFYFTLGEA